MYDLSVIDSLKIVFTIATKTIFIQPTVSAPNDDIAWLFIKHDLANLSPQDKHLAFVFTGLYAHVRVCVYACVSIDRTILSQSLLF